MDCCGAEAWVLLMILCLNEDARWADECCVLSLAVSGVWVALVSLAGLEVGNLKLTTAPCRLAIAQLYYHIGVSSIIPKCSMEIPTAVPLELNLACTDLKSWFTGHSQQALTLAHHYPYLYLVYR